MKHMTFPAWREKRERKGAKQLRSAYLCLNITNEGLELLFELTAYSGARHDRGKVDGQYSLILKGLLLVLVCQN